jgi:hypothetical protein
MTIQAKQLRTELSRNYRPEADHDRDAVGEYGYDNCDDRYPAESGSQIIAHAAA